MPNCRWAAAISTVEPRAACALLSWGLTLPSRGRPQAGFAHLRPPLMSNVRRRIKTGLLLSRIARYLRHALHHDPHHLSLRRGQDHDTAAARSSHQLRLVDLQALRKLVGLLPK